MATQASDTANSTASKRARGASADELAVIAQRAQAFTNASGVAIALSEGTAGEIVCRARSGASAPDVGAALRIEGTFTGLCIQTGKELRCDDCETDTRVDMTAIRALGIRSMVVTPVREDNRVVGVVAVFAPTPHAFTITHVAVLKTMADQISVLLQKRAMDGTQPVEAAPAAPPAIVAKPVPQAAAAAPAPVVIKPSPTLVRSTPPATAKVEPIRSTPVEVVPLAVPTTKREESHIDPPRANFGTFDSVANEHQKSGGRSMAIGVVAVLVLAAGGTFTFLKWQKPSSAHAPQQVASAPAVQPGNSNSSQTQSAAPANTQAAQPTATIAANSSVPTIKAADVDSKKAKSNAEKTSNASNAEKAPADKVEKQVAVATFVPSGPSKISGARNSDQSAPEIAPSFTAGGSAAPLSTLTRPVATSTPSAATIEQSQLEPLQLIKTVPPAYPAVAKARRMGGPVVVEVKVGKDGRVSNPKFISGQPIFKDAAFEAVMQYKFKPAKLNGQPIEQVTQIRLNFTQQ